MKIPQLITTLALAVSFGSSHSAVHLSPNKTGQAIIVPYYSASTQIDEYSDGIYTQLSLTNTKDAQKAVKIHFKESNNGKILTSFNVYLKGHDIWTMALGQVDGELIMDTPERFSVIAEGHSNFPEIPIPTQQEWLWENGTIEIIEMGEVDENIQLYNGRDLPFGTFWQTGHDWEVNSEAHMSPATGGLHTQVTLMGVSGGHSANIPVIHLDNFYEDGTIQHTAPGDAKPNLSTGTHDSMVVVDGKASITTWPTGYEAVSALLMHNNLTNEFNLEAGVAAQTEWIISMPTLHYHLNANHGVKKPFKTYTVNSNDFWFPMLYTNKDYFNREGQLKNHYPCSNCSPIPPELLSHSVTNLIFYRLAENYNPSLAHPKPAPLLSSESAGNTRFINASYDPNETDPFWSYDNGKVKLDLNPQSTGNNDRGHSKGQPEINHTFYGLPVIGFSYTRFSNANAQPGTLAQYAFVRKHYGEKKVIINTPDKALTN